MELHRDSSKDALKGLYGETLKEIRKRLPKETFTMDSLKVLSGDSLKGIYKETL